MDASLRASLNVVVLPNALAAFIEPQNTDDDHDDAELASEPPHGSLLPGSDQNTILNEQTHRTIHLSEEDRLLVYLKHVQHLAWSDITQQFRRRTDNSLDTPALQTTYCRLRNRLRCVSMSPDRTLVNELQAFPEEIMSQIRALQVA